MRKDFMGIALQEGASWRQKARIQWLKEVDSNTNISNGNKKKNLIKETEVEVKVLSHKEEIPEHVIHHLKLYTKDDKVEAFINEWDTRSCRRINLDGRTEKFRLTKLK